MTLRLPSPLFWIGCLCFVIAIALQIQTTLFYQYETYKGLRLCVADAVLPIAGLGTLISLLRHRSLWPIWPLRHVYIWLAGLFVILAAALMQSHALFGEWSYWGYTNKLPGMAVIAAYFCLGGWIATNAGERNITILLRSLMGFFIALMVLECGMLMAQEIIFDPTAMNRIWPDYPLRGLMDNRNAYALFALCTVSLMLCFHLDRRHILPRALVLGVMALFPYFILQIGSRAGMIASLMMAVILLIVYRRAFLPCLGAAALGTLLILGSYAVTGSQMMLFKNNELDIIGRVGTIAANPSTSATEASADMAYKGDSFRLQILDISVDMIKDRPLFGSGLGSSFFVQEELRAGRYDIIESTPIWLWVETGLFGLFFFAAFYLLCARALLRGTHGDDMHATLCKGMALSLLLFGLMTCLHEMMMSRQIWFLLGLALALPAAHIRKRQGV